MLSLLSYDFMQRAFLGGHCHESLFQFLGPLILRRQSLMSDTSVTFLPGSLYLVLGISLQ